MCQVSCLNESHQVPKSLNDRSRGTKRTLILYKTVKQEEKFHTCNKPWRQSDMYPRSDVGRRLRRFQH